MTGGHNLFRLYALVICDHCPPPPPHTHTHTEPREMSWTLLLCLQFPIVATTLCFQLAGKTMTGLPRSLLLYCTAMVAYVYQTPTFHYKSKITAHLPGYPRPAQELG